MVKGKSPRTRAYDTVFSEVGETCYRWQRGGPCLSHASWEQVYLLGLLHRYLVGYGLADRSAPMRLKRIGD